MIYRLFTFLFIEVFFLFSLIESSLGNNIDNVIDFLENSEIIRNPRIQLALTNIEARDTARRLFDAQISGLKQLKGTKDIRLISPLIRFLGYSTPPHASFSVGLSGRKVQPSIDELCDHFPAFSVIMDIPNAGPELAKYALNTENPLDYRIAVFHVLRYKDKNLFNVVVKQLSNEFKDANQETQMYLKAIEDGTRSFKGIYPFEWMLKYQK